MLDRSVAAGRGTMVDKLCRANEHDSSASWTDYLAIEDCRDGFGASPGAGDSAARRRARAEPGRYRPRTEHRYPNSGSLALRRYLSSARWTGAAGRTARAESPVAGIVSNDGGGPRVAGRSE